MIRSVIAVATAIALGGCVTTGPYAIVEGERMARADAFEDDVLIYAVDGKLDMAPGKTQRLEPGQRELLLGTVRQDRRSAGSATVVALNAKPCLRYYFVSRHESMSQVHPWKLVLKNVEPIPECVAKYPDQAPAAAPAPAATATPAAPGAAPAGATPRSPGS